MSIYRKWASREYPVLIRIIATMTAGSIFACFIPMFLITAGPGLDETMGITRINLGNLNVILGTAAILTGIFFALWSIISQLHTGRGTPIPAMATQTLILRGPFKYCRNPMSFGTILAYTGIAVVIGSWSALFFAGIFSLLMLFYVKLLEEKELLERFGESYRTYMASTNFFFPKLRE